MSRTSNPSILHPGIILHQSRIRHIRIPSIARLRQLRRIIEVLHFVSPFEELKVEP